MMKYRVRNLRSDLKTIRHALTPVLAIVASILLLWGLRCVFLHIQYNLNQDYYGTETYAEIFHFTSPVVHQTSSKLMKQVDEAFSFIGTDSEASIRFGQLSRYSTRTEIYPTVTNEKHSISFLSSSLQDDTGYLWFSYYNRRFDNNQSSVSGSGSLFQKCLVRLTLRKVDATWIVEAIQEHPCYLHIRWSTRKEGFTLAVLFELNNEKQRQLLRQWWIRTLPGALVIEQYRLPLDPIQFR